MSGCFESYARDSILSNRFELLQQVITEIKADFVGLIDTFKWKETFSINDLKNKFNFTNVFTVDMEDTRVEKDIGLTVMTNLDVKGFNIVRAFNRNYIETVLDKLNIYTCYLDDISEDTRLSEIGSLIKQVNSPAIIHGDLNTFTKEDLPAIDDVSQKFEKDNIALAARFMPIINDMRRCEVVNTIKSAGFIDSAKEWVPTMPTKLFPAVLNGGPFLRVDYIFHTEDIKVKDTAINTGELFDKVSDHLPLSAVVSY